MFTDRKLIVVLEYIIGFCLLIAVLPLFVDPQADWSDARWWAYLLFIVGAGLTLVSCASGMKQRIQLSQRIFKLEKMFEGLKDVQMQSLGQADLKHSASEQFIGSLN